MESLTLSTRDLPEGGTVLHFAGQLTIDVLPGLGSELEQRSREGADLRQLDISGIDRLDGAGAARLLALRAELAGRSGRAVTVVSGDEQAARLLELYDCPSEYECLKSQPGRTPVLEQIGESTVVLVHGLREILDAFGQLCIAVVRTVRAPRSVNWRDVPRLMERAGADGVPIVALINFLVGFIIALQSADQLRRFGASVFLADLLGLSLTRELAALMTAIVIAGRSGAAYAAELGTMRVNEEIDALRSLGFDPIRYLVLPRVIALAIVTPLLTLMSMVVAGLGGMLVAVYSLDLTPVSFVNQLQRALVPLDVIEGLGKSAVFAVVITFIACQRGLATRGGAAGVGASTTSAVVTILFHLIVVDAVLSALFNLIRAL